MSNAIKTLVLSLVILVPTATGGRAAHADQELDAFIRLQASEELVKTYEAALRRERRALKVAKRLVPKAAAIQEADERGLASDKVLERWHREVVGPAVAAGGVSEHRVASYNPARQVRYLEWSIPRTRGELAKYRSDVRRNRQEHLRLKQARMRATGSAKK